MIVSIDDLQRRTKGCPRAWSELVAAGRISGDCQRIELPDDALAKALKDCAKLKGLRGLGDVVHLFANPIAKGIDATFGTDLQHCPACAERRDALNEALPL